MNPHAGSHCRDMLVVGAAAPAEHADVVGQQLGHGGSKLGRAHRLCGAHAHAGLDEQGNVSRFCESLGKCSGRPLRRAGS